METQEARGPEALKHSGESFNASRPEASSSRGTWGWTLFSTEEQTRIWALVGLHVSAGSASPQPLPGPGTPLRVPSALSHMKWRTERTHSVVERTERSERKAFIPATGM